MQTDNYEKKMFAETKKKKKIVCLDKFFLPPLQNNNGPSLNIYIYRFFFGVVFWL